MLTKTKIPKHLKKYTVTQEYEQYSAINQAVWRYVMRQNYYTLKDIAHEAYNDGLRASGISIEKLPDVEEMNECLSRFGWGAATIDGFIPGVAFFEFQANGILPVVAEIRKLENIQYTPAPDIIHEAAGHAPILCDSKYSEYVKLFGEIGKKAIATKEEHNLFEAVRTYSNLLEKGESTEEEIAEAKKNIEEVEKTITGLSEAEKIGRLYWWTVEYGLIGDLTNPKVYGAGLLSSVSEGRNALDESVEKLPFELEKIIQTDFDITKPQPQLFVCRDFEQLIEGVKEFAKEMAFMKGGAESLEKAKQSANIATVEYSSRLQVTGIVDELLYNNRNEAIYLKMKGPTALAYDNKEIAGHGTETHQDGFGAPIGKLNGHSIPLERFSDRELERVGIVLGNECELQFESGVIVKGVVEGIHSRDGQIQIISFKNCSVTLNELTLFEPSWGTYDMAVGESIPSVYAGAADGEAYYSIGNEENVNQAVFIMEDTPLNRLYQQVRDVREGNRDNVGLVVSTVWNELKQDFPNDWLLRLELIELVEKSDMSGIREEILAELRGLQQKNNELNTLIQRGLEIL
ncbi:aromatic amino acid hydroxylase [Bacillus sp. FJAT-45350]|uniref:aromatic amino acid hydroxylase n=1 Tax=Bacillus sp. FJAT-45350 TaxID=2011014 RepID=UPI000BB807E4|nr:aromatic amino acid hydroxylase [Bacillus sp. FJAT-45350]